MRTLLTASRAAPLVAAHDYITGSWLRGDYTTGERVGGGEGSGIRTAEFELMPKIVRPKVLRGLCYLCTPVCAAVVQTVLRLHARAADAWTTLPISTPLHISIAYEDG